MDPLSHLYSSFARYRITNREGDFSQSRFDFFLSPSDEGRHAYMHAYMPDLRVMCETVRMMALRLEVCLGEVAPKVDCTFHCLTSTFLTSEKPCMRRFL
jgi:hypothetical protein